MNVSKQGYAHPEYVQSLSEFGVPLELPRSRGWLLKRPIPGTPYFDAMGPYPLFTCHNWANLRDDLDILQESSDLVSVVLVTDPFGDYNAALLQESFPQVMRPFKCHYVVDCHNMPRPNKHHRYYIRRAWEHVEVDIVDDPLKYLEEWIATYQHLIQRLDLGGIQSFSRDAFRQQLQIPGIVMIRARLDGVPVGFHLWYIQERHVYSHLAASTPAGYEVSAPYAIYDFAIRYFANLSQVDRIDLGAGAGLADDPDNGLARFKRGWTNDSALVYLCGCVLNPEIYNQLQPGGETTYFPAYRAVG